MKISIPIFIDYICQYNDHFYEIDKKRFSPVNSELLFYHDDIIKPKLVNFLEIYGNNILRKFTRSYNIIIDLTEEQVFYLSLKYDYFLEVCKEVKK